MTGIHARRLWAAGVLPSDMSIESGEKAILAAGIDREQIGVLVHGSVCRDHLEPATACRVHHRLGLPSSCVIYDVSNACLGLLNGMVQVANMIELGQVRAGLVVGSEGSRQLVETTVETLNQRHVAHAPPAEVGVGLVDHRFGELCGAARGSGAEPHA